MKRPWLLSVSLVGALVGLAANAFASGSFSARMLVPAYFDPPSTTWQTALSAPDQTILIVNPDNGPGTRAEPAYTRLITRARAEGHELIGYVHTSYGARSLSVVERDITRWASFYGVHDIFFDEVAASSGRVSYYRALTAYVRAHGSKLTVLNPGTVPARGYFNLGAIVVTFEDTYAAYQHAQFPAWLHQEPASEQANIVYAVPDAADAKATLAAMHGDGVGVGYVTGAGGGGGNPYGGLPPYYKSETGWLTK